MTTQSQQREREPRAGGKKPHTATVRTQDRKDVYSRVADKIVADLERGVRPWVKPWNAEHLAGRITRPLRHNGMPYRGINVVMLWMAAVAQGYACPIWMTFRQAKELGAFVRKGETGTLVVYANTFTATETDEDGDESERKIPYLKGYTVFNCEQIEGLPAHYYGHVEEPANPVERIEQADAFFAETGADIRHGGERAYYAIQPDYIQMPPAETFHDAESYAATLAHELTHWTRPIRPGSTATWGASSGATRGMPARSSSPRSGPPSSAPTSASRRRSARTTPLMWRPGSRC